MTAHRYDHLLRTTPIPPHSAPVTARPHKPIGKSRRPPGDPRDPRRELPDPRGRLPSPHAAPPRARARNDDGDRVAAARETVGVREDRAHPARDTQMRAEEGDAHANGSGE